MEEKDQECQADFVEKQSSLLSSKIKQLTSKSKIHSKQPIFPQAAIKTPNLHPSAHKDLNLAKAILIDNYDTTIHHCTGNNLQSSSPPSSQTHTIDRNHTDQTKTTLKSRQGTQISEDYQRNHQRDHSPIRNSRFMKHKQRTYTWVEHKHLLGSSKGSYRAGLMVAPKDSQRLPGLHRSINEEDRKAKRLNFFKKAHNKNNRHSSIYDHKILSLEDISGQGAIVFSDGTTLNGSWLEGSPVGLILIRYPDLSSYQGEICNYQPHGFGTLREKNGGRYTGQLCYGQPHGERSYYHQTGQIVFIGIWKRGVFYG